MNDKEKLAIMSWMLLEYRAYYHRLESKLSIHTSWNKYLNISDDLYDNREESCEALKKKLKQSEDTNSVGFGPNSASQNLVADKLSRPVGSFVILSNGETYQIKVMVWPNNQVRPNEFDSQIKKAQASKEKIKKQIKMLNQCLIEDFCIERPKISVLGLNPHAGDGGAIGKEEIEIIEPSIRELFDNGIMAFGPYPADSFFQPGKYKNFDAVLAMYHDQGLAPFKTLAYEEGVNYTAGLPFIRTSPDHGVAYDIAGKNIADEQSFTEAIFMALKIYKNRTEYNDLITNRMQPRKNNSGNNPADDRTIDRG